MDVELALDLLIAPLFWRMILGGDPTAPDYLDRLTDMLITACGG